MTNKEKRNEDDMKGTRRSIKKGCTKNAWRFFLSQWITLKGEGKNNGVRSGEGYQIIKCGRAERGKEKGVIVSGWRAGANRRRRV